MSRLAVWRLATLVNTPTAFATHFTASLSFSFKKCKRFYEQRKQSRVLRLAMMFSGQTSHPPPCLNRGNCICVCVDIQHTETYIITRASSHTHRVPPQLSPYHPPTKEVLRLKVSRSPGYLLLLMDCKYRQRKRTSPWPLPAWRRLIVAPDETGRELKKKNLSAR